MDSKAVEVSERYGNLTLNNPKSLDFGSDESEEDINNDTEGEKKDASDSSQKNLKKNKKCQHASPAEANSAAKNPKLSGLPKIKTTVKK